MVASIIAANNAYRLARNVVKCRFHQQVFAVEPGGRANVDISAALDDGLGRCRSDRSNLSARIGEAVLYRIAAYE